MRPSVNSQLLRVGSRGTASTESLAGDAVIVVAQRPGIHTNFKPIKQCQDFSRTLKTYSNFAPFFQPHSASAAYFERINLCRLQVPSLKAWRGWFSPC